MIYITLKLYYNVNVSSIGWLVTLYKNMQGLIFLAADLDTYAADL